MSKVLEQLTYNYEQRERTAFYASDFEKALIDIYFAWIQEPVTNPPSWNETLKWGAGRGVEDQFSIILKQSGIVEEDYDQKEHGRVELRPDKFDIQINGYVDFISKNGHPIECKSCNNKSRWDIIAYNKGEPRRSYVGQLAHYMHHLDAEKGALFAATIDGLHYWWLDCFKTGPYSYQCGKIEVDLGKEWAKWEDLYNNNIKKKELSQDIIWEYVYKYPLTEIDWKDQSKTKIREARNGRYVFGDWQIKYSNWKDKIIELQDEVPGYTNEELDYIQEATAGYTTW